MVSAMDTGKRERGMYGPSNRAEKDPPASQVRLQLDF